MIETPRPLLLDESIFADFLGGKIEGSEVPGVVRTLTILQLIKLGIYFLPGTRYSHIYMMNELKVSDLGELGWAGGVSENLGGNGKIILRPGGTSIPGYNVHNGEEIQELFKGWLKNMKSRRKVVWSSR